MSGEPKPIPRRKLSEKSKKLLRREAQHAEDCLEAEYQRPFEMRQEAEVALAKLPPWTAMLSVLFGGLMALLAIPSALSYHSFTWERQHRQLTAMQSPEQIEEYPLATNWRAVTLTLPFAAIAVGLTIGGRRHRLAYLGLGLYVFALLETALVAAICERSDGNERRFMAMELRVRLAEVKTPAPRNRGEPEPVDDGQKLALEKLRVRLEEEQQQRRMADLEAVQQNIRGRQRAEQEAAEKADRERLQQAAERRETEARQREEAERGRKEEEERKERELKELHSVELVRAREAREKQLQATQEQLGTLTASRDAVSKSRDESVLSIGALEARGKALAGQHALLLEQAKSQEDLIRGAEQIMDRATDQRTELTKQQKAAGALKPSEEKALKQAAEMAKAAAQLKSGAQKDLRDLKSQSNALQSEIRKLENELLKVRSELAKTETALKELDARIDRVRTAIADLKN